MTNNYKYVKIKEKAYYWGDFFLSHEILGFFVLAIVLYLFLIKYQGLRLLSIDAMQYFILTLVLWFGFITEVNMGKIRSNVTKYLDDIEKEKFNNEFASMSKKFNCLAFFSIPILLFLLTRVSYGVIVYLLIYFAAAAYKQYIIQRILRRYFNLLLSDNEVQRNGPWKAFSKIELVVIVIVFVFGLVIMMQGSQGYTNWLFVGLWCIFIFMVLIISRTMNLSRKFFHQLQEKNA